jgi:outer membrane protein OmpA-like peptidoglycan-associated protein
MPNVSKLILWPTVIIAILSSLTGCAPNPVPGGYPPNPPGYARGAAVGATTGVAFSGMTGSSLPLGALVGLFLGGAIGSYQDEQGAIKKLAAQGITVVRLGDIVEVVIPSDLVFDPENADILRSAQPMLNQLVALLVQYPDVNMSVLGHSDNVGSDAQQYRYASTHAQAIMAYIWTHGIPIERLSFYSVGASESSATFNSANGLAYNRRTVIAFWRHSPPGPLKSFQVSDPNCWTTHSAEDCKGK